MYEFLNKPLFYISETNFITAKQLLIGLVLVLMTWLISRITSRVLSSKLLINTKMSQDSIAVIQRIMFFSFLILTSLIILSFFKIPLANFAILSGAIAIGVGFGAKTIIENFLSGWILMTERPIRIGDLVEFDDRFGTIVSIGNRSTTIKRQDGSHLVIPNSQILESKLINLTIKDPYIRTFIRVGVSYGTDIELVKTLLMEIANKNEFVLNDPEPMVVFEDFGDNSLVFDLHFWASVQATKVLRLIRSDLRFSISSVLASNDIVIAFPQRDVHLFMGDSNSPNILTGDK
jgi:small-conductance mechanosensitive channel